MSLLITPSLYGSIQFYLNANDNWKEKAKDDLIAMLARDYSRPRHPSAERGIQFEDSIYSILKARKDYETVKSSAIFKKFLQVCSGGVFQKKTKCYITVDGEEHCLYGKIDVWFPNKILDIKSTGKEWNKWSELSYYNSIQHHVYCYSEKIDTFEYHIALFDGNEIKPPYDYKIVPYKVVSFDDEHGILLKAIELIRLFMEDKPTYNELWREKYSLY